MRIGSISRAATLAVLAVALLLAFSGSFATAINFPIAANSKRCFTEEIPTGTPFKLSYVFSDSGAMFLDVALMDASGVTLFSSEGKSRGSYSDSAQVGGDYVLCFATRTVANYRGGKARMSTEVAFSLKVGTEGIDYKNLATKEKLKPMEVQLRVMEDTVRSIHTEYVYYKQKEGEMRSTNEHMTAKVVWMALLVIVIFVAFSYLQLRHLKSYFRKKRMID